MHRLTLGAAAAAAVLWTVAHAHQSRPAAAPVHGYEIVKSYPHDPRAFTQGLVYLDGFLYEGTGLQGESTLRKVRLETGEVVQQHQLDDRYFGEGIAVWGKTIIQLTWQTEIGFVYDLPTFKPLKTFSYTGEGWGLTQDGARLIMSDGSSSLRFIDPTTLREVGRIAVRDGGVPVDNLNELEQVRGEIFANVWQSYRIARISPKTGRVTGWIDLTGLLPARDARGVDVMNGIAYDAKGDRLFVTGKLWPRLFEIRITPPRAATGRDASP
ncbi:MAG TPA: glutaminyl-peptide cyclotransferase [Vicinamibacterales bacterium]|nr:glutaminyl-peptide cyclotransferase [Vicinamibacterales bacterium]